MVNRGVGMGGGGGGEPALFYTQITQDVAFKSHDILQQHSSSSQEQLSTPHPCLTRWFAAFDRWKMNCHKHM